ncbi:hypothetical protein [Amycolatopsis antarctica]|uniref:hypothetical protein n=1 Tax=Amycolatopsis antarctica TaxID=1854586 RepID=UPI00105544CA|nr:hypothetical protein [Amycolatopsis antarctica]
MMKPPVDPFDDPRFDLTRPYPGGDAARERDYEAAQEEYERADHQYALAGGHGEHRQYYAHRTEVSRAVDALAEETRHHGRTISLWLVLDHGFPWRDACDLADLQRILAFLADPKNRNEAMFIAEAPPRRIDRYGSR